MPPAPAPPRSQFCLALASAVVEALRTTATRSELATLMEAIAREMGFRYYALAHHDDLRGERPDRVDLRDYPSIIIDHLIGQHRYRRDPVIRGSIFAGGAFLWSDLPRIITLDRHDRTSLERGAREGLNEGITVPYVRLGERMGSCTFAGIRQPERAHTYLGAAQMVGIFGFPGRPPADLRRASRCCEALETASAPARLRGSGWTGILEQADRPCAPSHPADR